MHLLVIGGKLQGTEAVYLAKKAGMEVTLIDRNPCVPARSIADHFVNIDAGDQEKCSFFIQKADLVIPGLENARTLRSLNLFCEAAGTPFIYDTSAYHISSSKKRSKKLFAAEGIPSPRPWPGCGFPVVLKPSAGSGSRGVRVIENPEPAPEFISEQGIAEQYISGLHCSVEVTGFRGNIRVHQITHLEMDSQFDCKRVTAPAVLDRDAVSRFNQIAFNLADSLGLDGIMDVEAVYDGKDFYVLEIDARFPSQTPIAVYWSSGINLVEELAVLYTGKPRALIREGRFFSKRGKGVVLEHIRVKPPFLEVSGEHLMADVPELQVEKEFFGADEAITDYRTGKTEWTATLICSAATRENAFLKSRGVKKKIMSFCGIKEYKDESPKIAAGGCYG